MKLTADQLNKFKELYKSYFDIELSEKEATEQATNLLNMMKTVYKPITKDAISDS
jgi:hypothetical protein